jgi:hypothetical protein
MVVRIKSIVVWFAILGFLIPVAIIAVDRLSAHGWWRPWMLYVFPSSYMIGAASGVIDGFFYEMAALAIIANTVLYAVVGFLLGLGLWALVKIGGIARP